jgi:hypothetical protein
VVRQQCLLHSCGAVKGRLKSRVQRQRSIGVQLRSRPDSHQSPANSCYHGPIIPTGSLVAPRGHDCKVHVQRLASVTHPWLFKPRAGVQCSVHVTHAWQAHARSLKWDGGAIELSAEFLLRICLTAKRSFRSQCSIRDARAGWINAARGAWPVHAGQAYEAATRIVSQAR